MSLTTTRRCAAQQRISFCCSVGFVCSVVSRALAVNIFSDRVSGIRGTVLTPDDTTRSFQHFFGVSSFDSASGGVFSKLCSNKVKKPESYLPVR